MPPPKPAATSIVLIQNRCSKGSPNETRQKWARVKWLTASTSGKANAIEHGRGYQWRDNMFSSKTLADYDGQRENNFTLLRLTFAWAVLFGHSFPITGTGSDPISRLMLPYAWIGSVAVEGFFAISGFLITASFCRRGSVDFVISRTLRLYPALMVCLLFTILVAGSITVKAPISVFLTSPSTWDYFFRNMSIFRMEHNVPGIFPDRPFAGSTNGSLWTLPAELRCYIAVLAFGFIGALDTKNRANVVLACLLIVGYFSFDSIPLLGAFERFQNPAACFWLGSFAWVNRKNIRLNGSVAILALTAPVMAIILSKYSPGTFFGQVGISAYMPAYLISCVYLTLYCAFRLPHVDIDRFGDISYGMYIYAWPVQQLVWQPGQSGYVNAALATLVVTPLAYASWVLIEKPALKVKYKIDQAQKKMALRHQSVPG